MIKTKYNMFALSLAVVSVITLNSCTGKYSGSKEDLGMLAGAGVGGLLGSQFGSGSGNTAAIIAGIFLGGLLGKDVGASLDRVDKQMMGQTTYSTLEKSPSGATSRWANPDTGNSGTVTPTRTYRSGTGYCREFQTSVTVNGKVQNAYGTACRQADGSWKITQ